MGRTGEGEVGHCRKGKLVSRMGGWCELEEFEDGKPDMLRVSEATAGRGSRWASNRRESASALLR